MSELTDALNARLTRRNTRGGWISLPDKTARAIIAALEELEQLQADMGAQAVKALIESAQSWQERAERVEKALTVLIEAAGRLPLDSWAEDHRPDSVDGCTHCGWDDISKCVYTAAHDTQQALGAARAALAGEGE